MKKLIPLSKEDEFDLRLKYGYLKDEYLVDYYDTDELGKSYIDPSFFTFLICKKIDVSTIKELEFLTRYRQYFSDGYVTHVAYIGIDLVTIIKKKFLRNLFYLGNKYDYEHVLGSILRIYHIEEDDEGKQILYKFLSVYDLSLQEINEQFFSRECFKMSHDEATLSGKLGLLYQY
jgi:hypothetical protein